MDIREIDFDMQTIRQNLEAIENGLRISTKEVCVAVLSQPAYFTTFLCTSLALRLKDPSEEVLKSIEGLSHDIATFVVGLSDAKKTKDMLLQKEWSAVSRSHKVFAKSIASLLESLLADLPKK